MSLSIVCWKWSKPGYRSEFGPETVNILRAMVGRSYAKPFRFLCVTDDPIGLDPGVEVVAPWNDFVDLPSPHGGNNPSCYRRLRAFHPEIGNVFGPRFVMMDLDTVITGDLTAIFDRTEDIVLAGDTNPRTNYNGGLLLMTAGARPQVWQDFDPWKSPRQSLKSGAFGSDQAWLSYCLGPHEAKFTKADGVYSFRNDLRQRPDLPSDCRLVMFHGRVSPWEPAAQTFRWVRSYYCRSEVAA